MNENKANRNTNESDRQSIRISWSDPAVPRELTVFRANYLRNAISDRVRRICQRAGIAIPTAPESSPAAGAVKGIDWPNWRFHIENRFHIHRRSSDNDLEAIFRFCPEARKHQADLRRIVFDGVETGSTNERIFYDLSVLPLNLLLGCEVLRYFIPPADYLSPHVTKKPDPYGIVHGPSRATVGKGSPTAITDVDSRLILGSHKFTNTLLFNVDFYCPIGCSDCYKTRFGTREYLHPQSKRDGIQPTVYRHSELGDLIAPTKGHVMDQTRRTVQWMNSTPRGQQVYDVIVSGGEPLTFPNQTIKDILDEFRLAKNLRVLRICTGTIFLGLPFRIDDELLDILCQFSEETGIRVTFQSHLGNHQMISPEAVIAVDKIRRRALPIYSQIPIKAGINFFPEDVEATVESLIELGRRQVTVGVEPYMFIVDMHPSTNAFYVPIELLMAVWGRLVESHDHPGLERPRTLSVLFEGGNIILSGSTLFAMEKAVDRDRGVVTYLIPRVDVSSTGSAVVGEVFEYHEPLNEFNDDPDSIRKLGLARMESMRRSFQGKS